MWSGYRDALTRKNVGYPSSGLNAGSSLISQEEGMSESPVETVEKPLVSALSGQGASHRLTPREARGVQSFKRLQCLTLLENL